MKHRITTFIFIIFFSLSFSQHLLSQKSTGFDFEGGMLVSDLDESLSFNFAVKYNYWVNPYIGGSFGLIFNCSTIDRRFDSPAERMVSYYIDDKDIINLSGIVGLKLSTPTFKGFGIMSDANFLFDPIPYNSVSVDKKYFDANSYLEKNKIKSRTVFTHFNPSFSLQLSLFYEIKQDSRKMRFALGAGVTNYNVYNTYYRAKIDNIYLRDYLKLRPNDLSTVIFLRVSGFEI